MNLGEFRNRTKNLPDDTDILIEDNPMEYAESVIKYVLNPVLDNSYAILLSYEQVVNSELDIDVRIDAALEFGDVEDNKSSFPLYGADPDCDHKIEILWSGYKCTKCPGWYCE